MHHILRMAGRVYIHTDCKEENKKGKKGENQKQREKAVRQKTKGAVQCKKNKVVQLGKRTCYSELMTQITEDLKWQPKKFELQSKKSEL